MFIPNNTEGMRAVLRHLIEEHGYKRIAFLRGIQVGQIYSKEDLFVDGDVEGSIEALQHRVTVGANGAVNASVKAREVIVLGTIRGNVEVSDRVEIRKEAKLAGDIRTARITIEDGAYFKGSIDIVKPEPAARQAATAAPTAR